MHSISEFGANVPAFLAKLWKMVEDPETNDLILWSSSGSSFIIRDQARFCKELLPMYYKHNNMASFIRQLNMYGFHKLVSIESGSTKLDQDEHEFHHPCFIKDHPYMLEHIKRKITGNRIEGVGTPRTEVVNKVLSDVRQMRSRQETMDSKLSQMKLENEALWRELAILRQKHLKQQQIVNKLIQFLVSLVQHPHNNGISVKRRAMPLMLQDKSGRRRMFPKSPQQSSFMKSPTGPVIHELDPAEYATALLDTVQDVDSISEGVPAFISEAPPSVESIVPQSDDCGISSDQNVEEVIDDPGHHFLIDGHSGMLTCEKSPNSVLFSNTASQTSAVDKPKRLIVNKRPRPKRKRPVKLAPKPEITIPLVSADGVNIIIPNVTEAQNLPGALNNVTSLPSNYSHVTPDTFITLNEDSTINLDDLKYITASNNPIVIQTSQANNLVVPNVIESRPPSAVNIGVDPAVKQPNVKKYNIGKNASMLFTNGKGKSPVTIKKEDDQFTSLDKVAKGSKRKFKEENDLKLNINLANSDSVAPVPAQALAPAPDAEPPKNDNITTVACTTGMNVGQLNRYTGTEEKYPKKVGDVDNHIESMQSELDTLKELLKNENLSLDASALLGIFANDDPLEFNTLDIPIPQESNEDVKENNSSKVAMYNPSMVFDLNDVFSGSEWSLPDASEPLDENSDLPEDIFSELNTPNISLSSQSFNAPTKKKKKL